MNTEKYTFSLVFNATFDDTLHNKLNMTDKQRNFLNKLVNR